MMPPRRFVSYAAKITLRRIISIGVATHTAAPNLSGRPRYGGAVARKIQRPEDARIKNIKTKMTKRRKC